MRDYSIENSFKIEDQNQTSYLPQRTQGSTEDENVLLTNSAHYLYSTIWATTPR